MADPREYSIVVFGGPMISLQRLSKRDDGQDLLEYGLLASLIAIFAITAVGLLAGKITNLWWGAIAAVKF